MQLLWDAGDYLSSNGEKLQRLAQNKSDSTEHFELTTERTMLIEDVWMLLFGHLAKLCVDVRLAALRKRFMHPMHCRPEARKSANETLFATLATHGELFSVAKWESLLWTILFPLLDNISNKSQSIGSANEVQPSSIMVHHSRNTVGKQWDETKALALTGVARVFAAQHSITVLTSDLPKAWEFLLGSIERNAIDPSAEVVLSAATTFLVCAVLFSAGQRPCHAGAAAECVGRRHCRVGRAVAAAVAAGVAHLDPQHHTRQCTLRHQPEDSRGPARHILPPVQVRPRVRARRNQSAQVHWRCAEQR